MVYFKVPAIGACAVSNITEPGVRDADTTRRTGWVPMSTAMLKPLPVVVDAEDATIRSINSFKIMSWQYMYATFTWGEASGRGHGIDRIGPKRPLDFS
jgi:hypothetical protein